MTGVVQLRDLTHRYGKTVALQGVTAALPGGCMVGLIGPDGVGKSTLLGLVAGARRIQAGTVEVLGGDMAQAAHRQSVGPRIAYMPQGLGKNLYAELSVRENVDFFGRLFELPAAERRARIERLLRATGLDPFPDRPAGKLSGGMKQKLGLCCALIHDPDLLILDEPTTGVDPLSRRQFWQLIDAIRAERQGMSVLVSTAYMEEAQRFDWLVAMDAGRALATGTPRQLMERTGTASLEAAFVALLPERPQPATRPLSAQASPRAENGQPAIVARNLTRRFGTFTAVERVSFTIPKGEIFGFLGSNGCGKTTTMKMLTGLLPPTEGEAFLLGRPVQADDRAARHQVGYMSQAFSLYGELTVEQNLVLHARLFGLSAAKRTERIALLVDQFGLAGHLGQLSADVPLGVRQRLSLAAAVIHEPAMLILDEPTSGVDPLARDRFWDLLTDLASRHGVTIFVSTHFMNEAMRCDRISLMHAGRVLAADRPQALIEARGAQDLEEAFIGYLEEATGKTHGSQMQAPLGPRASRPASSAASETAMSEPEGAWSRRGSGAEPPASSDDAGPLTPLGPRASRPASSAASVTALSEPGGSRSQRDSNVQRASPHRRGFSLARLLAYSYRETLEVLRDPVRLAFAFAGTALLMLVFGYGITMDVEDLAFATLDLDRSPESRLYIAELEGSRYFRARAPLADERDLRDRLQAARIALAVEIPPSFGRDLQRGGRPQVSVWIDGANPFRAETVLGYVEAVHARYLEELARREPQLAAPAPFGIVPRFRYNPSFESIYAMAPGVPAMLLVLLPAILMAVSVVREKELGSITNFHVTPTRRLEFLLGKQLPYIALAMASFVLLTAMALLLFGVPLKGSASALAVGALLYVTATTGIGLLVSVFTRSQVAAVFATAVLAMVPTMLFSGLMQPVSTLQGPGKIIGSLWPAAWYMHVSVGAFTKGLGWRELYPDLLALAAFIPVLTAAAALGLRKQDR